MAFFKKGVYLEQHKEPMLTADILEVKQGIKTFDSITVGRKEDELSKDEIIGLAKDAEIKDENDGIFLSDKLEKAEKGLTLIIDAIDDEPYVCGQMALVIHRREELVLGIKLIARAINAADIHIAVYGNIPGINSYITSKIDGIEIREIKGKYPAESRSYSRIMRKKDNMVIGAGAAVHLGRALTEGRKMTSTFLTVAGDAVSSPKNVEVPIGTTVSDLLKLCGLTENPETIVVGGSMTGKSIYDPENETVDEKTSAILAFLRSHITQTFNCIGCGRCAHACPEDLEPEKIRMYAEHGNTDMLRIYDPCFCNGCGACSYVCPARIDVAASVMKAKKLCEAKEDVASE